MITFSFDSSTEFKQHLVKHKIIPFSSFEQASEKATENQIPVQIQSEYMERFNRNRYFARIEDVLSSHGFDGAEIGLKTHEIDMDNPTGTYLLIEIDTSEVNQTRRLAIKDSQRWITSFPF